MEQWSGIKSGCGNLRQWHSGSCSGYSSLLALRPDKQDGLYFLSNTHGITTELRELSKAVFSLWDGEEIPHIDFKPTEYTAPKSHQPVNTDFSGTFSNPGYGSIEIDHGKVSLNGHALGALHSNGDLQFDEYNISLSTTLGPEGSSLDIPFESLCPPISFEKKA